MVTPSTLKKMPAVILHDAFFCTSDNPNVFSFNCLIIKLLQPNQSLRRGEEAKGAAARKNGWLQRKPTLLLLEGVGGRSAYSASQLSPLRGERGGLFPPTPASGGKQSQIANLINNN